MSFRAADHCLGISNEDFTFFFLIIQVLRPQHEDEVAKFNSFVVMQEVELGKQNTFKLLDTERIYCPLKNHCHLDMTQMYPGFLTFLDTNFFKKIKCNPPRFLHCRRQAAACIPTVDFPIG